MKAIASLTLMLTTATIGITPEPTSAAQLFTQRFGKQLPTQLIPIKDGLTYAERFDLGESYVDTVVYTMMDADPDLIEFLFDINTVRVSSDGRFATVAWRYDRTYGGVTLLAQQGNHIVILAERSEALPQYSLEIMGVPPAAAAEIAIN